VLDALKNQLPKILEGARSEREIYSAPCLADGPLSKRRKGGGLLCPICEMRHHSFLPFGLAGRRNARCPNCGSLERHRFLFLYLSNHLRWTRRRLKLLHIAPEPCIRNRLAPLPQIQYCDVDLFASGVTINMDITQLDFPSARFDGIICSHVLEHVEADRDAIGEIFRVLKPHGHALIMVPQDMNRAVTDEDSTVQKPAERARRFGHPYHVRTCGADYGDRFRAAGFEVTEANSAALSAHRRRHFRLNKCILHDCRKPST